MSSGAGSTLVLARSGLRGLPLLDPGEIERATGFVWIVRSFVTLPLTTLGLLATVAATMVGNVVAALAAGTITVLILLSLYHDTQLSKAIELLRRGQIDAAEATMRKVAEAPHRAIPQRQRARAYLAAIAWLRGDHAAALTWTRDRLVGARAPGCRMPQDEVYMTAASEVQLLALLGQAAEAHEKLHALADLPPGDRYTIVDATCRLLLAFVEDDVDAVRDDLGPWRDLCRRADDHGLATALLAWAHGRAGDDDAAVGLVHEARALADPQTLRRHAPAVYQWLDAYDDRALRYR
jgi:hypothetical protein